MLKKLGYGGALLRCPCHTAFVLLLLGGTTAGTWLAAHMGLALGVFTAPFVFSIWLAMRPERAADGAACATCAPDTPDATQRNVGPTATAAIAATSPATRSGGMPSASSRASTAERQRGTNGRASLSGRITARSDHSATHSTSGRRATSIRFAYQLPSRV